MFDSYPTRDDGVNAFVRVVVRAFVSFTASSRVLPMELTVCVCVRDGADHVDRCLRALVAETAPAGAPIVIVDHASRDATPELLARWARDRPGLRVLRFEGDGIAAARDFAWRQTHAPWVAFVDIDCEVQPGWAKAASDAVRIHASDARCGAFGGTNRVPDGPLLYRAYAVFLATYVGGHDSILNRPIRERRRVDHCPTLNVVYRRRALEEIGGFDPTYTSYCEDEDVSRRLVREGYTLWANPGMVVEHALPPTLGRWIGKMFRYGRGRSFYLKRNPSSFRPKFLAPAAAVIAYGAAALWTGGPGGPALRVAVVALTHLASVALLLGGEARRQRGGLAVWVVASVVVWLTHLSYGSGLLCELPRRRDKFVL
jgi:GT2 family glycosyltransferase